MPSVMFVSAQNFIGILPTLSHRIKPVGSADKGNNRYRRFFRRYPPYLIYSRVGKMPSAMFVSAQNFIGILPTLSHRIKTVGSADKSNSGYRRFFRRYPPYLIYSRVGKMPSVMFVSAQNFIGILPTLSHRIKPVGSADKSNSRYRRFFRRYPPYLIYSLANAHSLTVSSALHI